MNTKIIAAPTDGSMRYMGSVVRCDDAVGVYPTNGEMHFQQPYKTHRSSLNIGDGGVA